MRTADTAAKKTYSKSPLNGKLIVFQTLNGKSLGIAIRSQHQPKSASVTGADVRSTEFLHFSSPVEIRLGRKIGHSVRGAGEIDGFLLDISKLVSD